MLRDGSQSFPKMKLSPKVLNVFPDSPIRRMKKYASSARIAAARVVRPHLRSRSGIRLAAGRSRTERPAETVVTLASTPLRDRRPVAGHRRELGLVLGDQAGRQRCVRQL